MKKKQLVICSLGLLLVTAFCALANGAEPSRSWRTKQGGEIKAVWDRENSSDTKITLIRDADGKTYTVPVDNLSDDDQAYLQNRAAQDSGNLFAAGTDAGEKRTLTVNGVDFTFCWCPPGEFMMGSPRNEEGRTNYTWVGQEMKQVDAERAHQVKLTRGFWLLESEVTQQMWEAVMGMTVQEKRDLFIQNGKEDFFENYFPNISEGLSEAEIAQYKKIYSTMMDQILNDKTLFEEHVPLKSIGPNCPMCYVKWNDTAEFCAKLETLSGYKAVLPTEAQWEYACRAGTKTALYTGESLKVVYDGRSKRGGHAAALDPIAWYYWNSPDETKNMDRTQNDSFNGEGQTSSLEELLLFGGDELSGTSGGGARQTAGFYEDDEDEAAVPREVKQKQPNAWGLYDMLGNVSEWCADWYDANYYAHSPIENPTGPSDGKERVFRGGSSEDQPIMCRSARRGEYNPVTATQYLGFRLCILPTEE